MISPKTLAAIRERIDIATVVGESVKLVRKGRSLVGLCPFHKEKTPSFNVSSERGFYYCFGCKEKGNVFDFLMKLEGLTFPEAVHKLAPQAGVEVEDNATDLERREAEAARRAIEELYGVNQIAAHWFETQLRDHPLASWARDELAHRGLDVAGDARTRDALQAFRIGYAPAGWTGLSEYLARQGVSPVTASRVGLVAPRKTGSGYYDWFRHRLMFAIIDTQGRVIGFSGRVLPDPESGAVEKESPKYINSPESPVYQKGQSVFGLFQARQAIREKGETVLVEGNFDVVSLHARGISNVVAPLGTAFTLTQAKLLRRYAPNVTVLFDGDAAGRKATKDARDTCQQSGLVAKVAVLPGAKDPDEFIRTSGAAALTSALSAARGILEHLIETALDDTYTRADARARAGRIKEIEELIAADTDPAVRAMAGIYVKQIAQRLGLNDGASTDPALVSLTARLVQATAGPTQNSGRAPVKDATTTPNSLQRPPSPWEARSRTDAAQVALDIFGGFLDFPELLSDPNLQEVFDCLEGDTALGVAALRQLSDSKELDVAFLLARLPGSIHTFAASRLAAPKYEQREQAEQEILRNAHKLKRLGLSRQKAQVVEALHRIERNGDPSSEVELLRELYARHARERAGSSRG